jgi:DNA repair exonuclease SbcCD ATPase subunit
MKILLAAPLLLVLWNSAAAQQDISKNDSIMPTIIKPEEVCEKTGEPLMDELKMKACIKQQQKEYRELLDNGEEAVKLSGELEKAVDKTAALATDDQKKLDRLEKLFKKIRNSLGGEEDEPTAEEEKPLSVKSAIQKLNEKASGLLDELKKSTRYSISVVAIQSSNAVIRLVRYIRFNKN